MSNEPLFDRQKAAFRKLQDLVQDRAAREQSIAAEYQKSLTAAETEVGKARRQIAIGRKKAVEEIEAEHTANTTAIAEKYDALQATAEKQRFDYRKKMVDDYSAALDKKRTEHKDRLWTADSVLEAAEKEAQDRFEDLERKAASADEQIEKNWDKADDVLKRSGLDQDELEEGAKPPEPAESTEDPVARLQKALADAETALVKLNRASLLKLTGVGGTAALIFIAGAVFAGIGFGMLATPTNFIVAGVGTLVGGTILRVVVGILAKKQVTDLGEKFAARQAAVKSAITALRAHAKKQLADEQEAAKNRHIAERNDTDEYYKPKIAEIEQKLDATLAKIEGEYTRVTERVKVSREQDSTKEEKRYQELVTSTTTKYDTELAAAEKTFADKSAAAAAIRDTAFKQLSDDWFAGHKFVSDECQAMAEYGSTQFPNWSSLADMSQPLPTAAPVGIRYGEHAVDVYALPEGVPGDTRLNPPEPLNLTMPAFLPFSQKCSVLVKARDTGRPAAITALQAMMLRFLTGVPAGKVRFTVIDPVGLGENFAAFMHLADFDEKLIGSRIWTEPGHIEKRLQDLTEHMENVIQKYLRNQYKSIEEYNQAAGEVAEPYRVLVIANFPTNFNPDAARRLVSIMSSGPACGVCTIVGVDLGFPMPRDFSLSDLEQVAFNLRYEDGKFIPEDPDLVPFPLKTDVPPEPQEVAALVNRVGAASRDAARVEVPFEFIMPTPDKVWTSSTSRGFNVPIGRAGATGKQIFTLGKGTAQHALVAGKTGSGKSTMLHALITNLALTYSPEEAELYLIDFKKGVEFKTYAEHDLPHARVIAIESEREFGMSVLQRLDGILRERGERFRDAGCNDLPSYREARPNEVTPRILLVVDEFQEFFVEDDKLASECALLMDRLVRQGRAFGVHLILGSQSLGGAFSLARSTIDQMAVRIALQCSEADAQLILSKDNTAARLLNRPGDAIYNDANGLVEGNDPFQVVWLGDEKKEAILNDLRRRASESGKKYPPPLVFEGSASADITVTEPLVKLIEAPLEAIPAGPPVFFLGDPVAIKDPTVSVFRPQSGANLLMLGQHEESALALMSSGLISLAAKLRSSTARPITIIDGTPDDSDFAGFLNNTAVALGLSDAVVDRHGMGKVLADLAGEFQRRQSGETSDRTPRFLFIHGLHRLRELRKAEDDFGFGRKGDKVASAGDNFSTLMREGPPFSIHCVVWCDSLTNLQRAIDRQGLREFVLRVLFQMSASDSSHMLDSPVASRLGRSRALYVEEGGERPEKFRPYGLPSGSWLRSIGDRWKLDSPPPPAPTTATAEPEPSTNGDAQPATPESASTEASGS